MTDAELIRALAEPRQGGHRRPCGELTTLDQAIGDGDHGLNMARGFDAVAAPADELAGLGFGAALQKAGMTLVMKVGGASGPLYGSGLMAMGKAAAERPADAAGGGSDARRRHRGGEGARQVGGGRQDHARRAGAGAGGARGRRERRPARGADAALEATRPMRATKGRAAFLGERSVGHLDPGARSSTLLIHAVCDVLEGK